MSETKRQCQNCLHFRRDFNRYLSKETLEGLEAGYCMCEPPEPYLERFESAEGKELITLFPLVDEDAVCRMFEPIKEK